MTGDTGPDGAVSIEQDRGAMIDPNGCPFYQNCS